MTFTRAAFGLKLLKVHFTSFVASPSARTNVSSTSVLFAFTQPTVIGPSCTNVTFVFAGKVAVAPEVPGKYRQSSP